MRLNIPKDPAPTPLEQKIRELEHECEIGLPHESCWDCGTATLRTPLPRLESPIVTDWGNQVSKTWVDPKYTEMQRELYRNVVDSILRKMK